MRKQGILFLAFTFIFTLVLMTSCILWTGYPSGPIKWTFVSGDGSWNRSSRIIKKVAHCRVVIETLH